MANNGLTIACLAILLVLIPRIQRFVLIIVDGNISSEEEQSRGRRALIGAMVYIVETIAYFILITAVLSKFGISLTIAVISAIVVSAAVSFGAQGVIADFLGGMFVITEEQYDIGNWMEFHSPSGIVQGGAVNMILHVTITRTLNGEEIIMPNSGARMCINYSSQWSRTVTGVSIPMTAGGSIKDLEERTAAAAKYAIVLDSAKDAVLSETKLQSSMKLNPLTVMSLPWAVTMRLIVGCKPGDQWFIERAIRVAAIDTRWSDHGEHAQRTPFAPAEEVIGHVRDDTMAEQLRQVDAKQGQKQQLDNGDSVSTEIVKAVANTTAQPDTVETKLLETQTADKQDRNERSDLPCTGADLDDTRCEQEDSGSNGVIRKLVSHPDWEMLMTRQEVRRILSAGGRACIPTIMLLVTLMILDVLSLITVGARDNPSGWLAPNRWSDRAATQEEVSEESSAPQSSSQPASATRSVQPTEASQQTRTSQNQPSETSQQARSTQNRTPSTATSTRPDSDQSNIDGESTGGSQLIDSTNNAKPNSAGAQ